MGTALVPVTRANHAHGWGPLMETNEYRLDRLERDIAEIKASVMSVQASVAQIQLGMHDMYVPRREFESWKTEAKAEHSEIERNANKRLDRLDATISKAAWTTVGALITALLALWRAATGV